jgi:hypothetical protein
MDLGSSTASAFFAIGIGAWLLLAAPGANDKRRTNVGPTLVIRRFGAYAQPSDGEFVSIAGREPGLVAWLLTSIGLDAEWRLIVTGQTVAFRKTSLYGEQESLVALDDIASAHCGYKKPIGLLFAAAASAVLSIVVAAYLSGIRATQFAVIPLFLAVVLAILYFTQKSLSVGVETKGGMVLSLNFRPSIIENVRVDIEQTRYAVRIINALISEKSGMPAIVSVDVVEPPAMPQQDGEI